MRQPALRLPHSKVTQAPGQSANQRFHDETDEISGLTLPHPVPATGVTCAQCHGATISAVVIGWDHRNMAAKPGGEPYCMYCHLTGQNIVATAGLTAFQTRPINHNGTITATDTCEYCHTPGSNAHPVTYPNPWDSGTTGNIRGP